MNRTDPGRGLVLLVGIATAAGGCASAGNLADYDFRDRSLGVVTLAPPHPDVFTDQVVDLDGTDLAGAIFRIGTDLLKESEAGKARARLDSAALTVDVAGRLGRRVLEDGARQLRARAVETAREADYEIEIRVERYGIEADSWDDQANFVLEAEVRLLDGPTGRRIWNAKVSERDPVNGGVLGGGSVLGNVITARALASLSVPEMERAMEGLADYCADRMLDKLRRGLDKVRG
jgi:hypothetical protein